MFLLSAVCTTRLLQTSIPQGQQVSPGSAMISFRPKKAILKSDPVPFQRNKNDFGCSAIRIGCPPLRNPEKRQQARPARARGRSRVFRIQGTEAASRTKTRASCEKQPKARAGALIPQHGWLRTSSCILHPKGSEAHRARAPEPPAGRASCPPRNVVSEFNKRIPVEDPRADQTLNTSEKYSRALGSGTFFADFRYDRRWSLSTGVSL
jgi:hypothetical protein